MVKRKKTGGRIAGVSRNKATIEREVNAAQVIDRARKEGRDLAVTVLARLMGLAEGATGLNRPTSKAEMAKNGGKSNPDGDWDRFGSWFDRTAYCAKELAKYESPQIKSMEQPTPAPTAAELENQQDQGTYTLRVFEGGKQIKAA